ncbi:MAG TPA: transcription elongation factor GreA [Dehalococcoidales bacterium]|nr:transcription elongation factor GreA [Dehalococcoidales bacterium]
MTGGNENVRLGEAARRFLAGLPDGEREASQHEIYRFVRWYGTEQALTGMSPPQVANYAEQLSQSDTDYARKLELIRGFLAHARKQGWSRLNLAVHLKARKAKNKAVSASRERESVLLTQQRYDELKVELTVLLDKRPQLIEDIRSAAADKDFKENAPLDAAKEQRGYLEGRILELEGVLAAAVIMDKERESRHRIGIGDDVVLQDLASGEEVSYTLVSSNEVDPAAGKISNVSPIGKAVVGRAAGDEIEVTVPAGKLRYRILSIGD